MKVTTFAFKKLAATAIKTTLKITHHCGFSCCASAAASCKTAVYVSHRNMIIIPNAFKITLPQNHHFLWNVDLAMNRGLYGILHSRELDVISMYDTFWCLPFSQLFTIHACTTGVFYIAHVLSCFLSIYLHTVHDWMNLLIVLVVTARVRAYMHLWQNRFICQLPHMQCMHRRQ